MPATSCDPREDLGEVVDAESREGDRGYVVIEIENGETPVLRLHAHGDLMEQIFILTTRRMVNT
jgi:hypothetical protein